MHSVWKRLLLAGTLCATPSVASAQTFPSNWQIGPSKGEVIGAAIGAGVVIGVVIYLVVPKQKMIEGCVESSDGVNQVRSQSNGQVYEITNDSVPVNPGRILKLKGRTSKSATGKRIRVLRIVEDEGACTPG
jgi:hypothetical protein